MYAIGKRTARIQKEQKLNFVENVKELEFAEELSF
jgi:hypothetical protein